MFSSKQNLTLKNNEVILFWILDFRFWIGNHLSYLTSEQQLLYAGKPVHRTASSWVLNFVILTSNLFMTPTLLGRWQTRLLLFATVGVLVSLPFAIGWIGSDANSVYFWILGYVGIFGLGWDVLYNYIQKFRWDRDWPAAYQLLAGIWELVFVFCGIKVFGFLPIPLPKEELPLGAFLLHYSIVWLAVFIVSQSLMRIIFLRWRFRGGQWL